MENGIAKAKAWRKFVNEQKLIMLPLNYALQEMGGYYWIVRVHSDKSGWWTTLESSECFKIRHNAMIYAFDKFNLPDP